MITALYRKFWLWLGAAGIMLAASLVAKGRDFPELAASVGGTALLVVIRHALF